MTTDLASVFRSAVEKAGLELVVDVRAVARAGLRRSRHVGEDRPEPALERVQVHVRRADSRSTLRSHGDRVELRVADTGVGIPEADLPRMFERFHRVKHARARTHEGTGIGLALVQELARLHGGTVSVDEPARARARPSP